MRRPLMRIVLLGLAFLAVGAGVRLCLPESDRLAGEEPPMAAGHPAGPAGRPAQAPALAARGDARERGETPAALRARIDDHIAALASRDAATAQTARAALRTLSGEGRLGPEDWFHITLLPGLDADAAALQARALKTLSHSRVDLAPFVPRLLAACIAKDAGRRDVADALLSFALDRWRFRKAKERAKEAGEGPPRAPLHAELFEPAAALLKNERASYSARIAIASRLDWLGPRALALVPAAVQVVRDAEASQEARHAPWRNPSYPVGASLALLGAEVIPYVLPLLAETRWEMSHLGVHTLDELGATALPALCRAARDPNPRVRENAVRALGFSGAKSAEGLDVLRACLDDANVGVREEAAYAIVNHGPEARADVMGLLKRQPGPIRTHTVYGLRMNRYHIADEVLPAVFTIMADPADDEVQHLLDLLQGIGARGVPATYGILRMITGLGPLAEPSAQDFVGYLGPLAVPWYLTALESGVEDLHAMAARALAWQDELDAVALERARRWLRDHRDSVHAVWLAIAVVDERDPVSQEILVGALTSGGWDLRAAAAVALARLETTSFLHVDALQHLALEARRVYDSDRNRTSAEGISVGCSLDIEGAFRTVLDRDLERAFALLDHDDRHVRSLAARSTRDAGSRALPFARRLLPTASERARVPIVHVLGNGGDFPPQEALLAAEMRGTHRRARNEAAHAIYRRTQNLELAREAAECLAREVATEARGYGPSADAYDLLRIAKKYDRLEFTRAALRAHRETVDAGGRARVRRLITELADARK